MILLRRALGPLTAVWLACQATTLVVLPAVLSVALAHVEELECTCAHGDHAICPMHHKSAAGRKLCLLQDADDSGIAVLTSLLGQVALVPAPTQPFTADATPALIAGDVTTASLRSPPPDPPPPRT